MILACAVSIERRDHEKEGHMAVERNNLESLRNAGFTIKTPLPDEYQDVLDRLTDDQLAVLIQVKKMFDEAEGKTTGDVGPYRAFFVPF
jgi:hypothetical protein